MKLLFLDTETGGLDPSKNSLLQVGLIAYDYDNGCICDKLSINIKENIYHVNPYALKYNGLNLCDIYESGVTKEEAVKKIINFIKNNFENKPILVGHNINFDKNMLNELFNQCNYDINDYINYRMLDTMSLIWALHLLGKLPIEACSSDGAFEYFQIEVKQRHHALDDCMATLKLFEKLLCLIPK